jgi:peptide/nickel transport system ATP-binding protein
VEYGSVTDLFYHPKHPYTQGLLESIPKFGQSATQQIRPIQGSVPSAHEMPSGCKFHPRCPRFMAGVCDTGDPPLFEVDSRHWARCFLYGR